MFNGNMTLLILLIVTILLTVHFYGYFVTLVVYNVFHCILLAGLQFRQRTVGSFHSPVQPR